jgi:hypothetical protein
MKTAWRVRPVASAVAGNVCLVAGKERLWIATFVSPMAAWGAIVAARARGRAITDEEGNRLLRIVRRQQRLGGYLASSPNGLSVGPRHGPGADRAGHVHER